MQQPLVFHDTAAAILFFGSAILVNGIEVALRPRSEAHGKSSGERDWTLPTIYLLILVAVAGSAVTAALRVAPLGGNPWVWVVLGLALLWIGFVIRIWAVQALGRFFQLTVVVQEDHQVVEGGPYRWVRHPGYLGAIVGLVSVGVAESDWASIAIMLVGTVTAFVIRIRVEERVMLAQLGDDYATFCKGRARLVPGLY